MRLTQIEELFLEKIKSTTINECRKNNIIPSVIATIGIMLSKWGTSKEFINTKNIYLLPVNKEWIGICYSKLSEKYYEKVSDCDEVGAILYRVYNDHQDSIVDFISELLSCRRSENGPLRFDSIIGERSYRNFINILMRNGFFQKYLHRNDDMDYVNTMISIIEKYQLYDWDNLLNMEENNMSKTKKKHHYQNSQSLDEYNSEIIINDDIDTEDEYVEEDDELSNDSSEEVNNEQSHMYRVRLDWDKRDTQIFSSPSYEDAKKVALEHEGYKIYIDDDGELLEDPWQDLRNQDTLKTEEDGPKPIIHALKGEIIILNNTPVFKSAIDKTPMTHITGKFYFYDNSVTNGRAKITVHKDIYQRDPSLILGYINI